MVRWIIIGLENRENTRNSAKKSLGYYELKKHTPWFDKGMLKIIRSKEK
jgi:hypothetical protein